MFKRTLSFLSLFLVLSMLLTACGGTDSDRRPRRARPRRRPPPAAPRARDSRRDALPPARAAPPPPRPARRLEPPASRPPPACCSGRTSPSPSCATSIRSPVDRWSPRVAGIYEPLMIYNTVKGELVPWLADKYELSADNKTLTFTLHNGVKWSDGQPFTANDVAFTFNLIKNKTGLQGPGLQAMGASGYIDSVAAPGRQHRRLHLQAGQYPRALRHHPAEHRARAPLEGRGRPGEVHQR